MPHQSSRVLNRRCMLKTTAAGAGLALVGKLSPALAAGGKVFRAGAAVVDITPTKLPAVVNGGFAERLISDITDPLHARCLVLDDGSVQVALVVVDNCVIPRPLMDEAKQLAHRATGLPVDRMMISATHCHSAPSVFGVLGTDPDEAYTRFLPGKIAEAIAAAHKNLRPARIGWAVGSDPTNVFCRRFRMKPGTARTCPFTGKTNDQAQMNPGYQNPNAIERTGPADTDVSVISIQTPEGKPLALYATYSTHYAGAPGISADYFGVFCQRIGEMLGVEKNDPLFVAMISNGTSGDANCCDFVNPPRKYDRFTVGEDVARAAYEACQKIRYYDWVPLVMKEELLTLRSRVPEAREVAEAKEHLAKLKGAKPRAMPDVYARETILLSEMSPTRELKLQAIRIGELGIDAMPNEVYGSTGLAIKAASPLKPTINVELANGYDGYLPPPEQHKLGGYTTWRARSSCLEEEAEPKIRAAVLDLLRKVATERRDEALIPAK